MGVSQEWEVDLGKTVVGKTNMKSTLPPLLAGSGGILWGGDETKRLPDAPPVADQGDEDELF